MTNHYVVTGTVMASFAFIGILVADAVGTVWSLLQRIRTHRRDGS